MIKHALSMGMVKSPKTCAICKGRQKIKLIIINEDKAGNLS